MSEKQWFSPCEIITGLTIDYKRDCKAVVGAYMEASPDAEITNDNAERRQSCIIWVQQEIVKDPANVLLSGLVQLLFDKFLTFYHILAPF